MSAYAGIGSRKTPNNTCLLMTDIARYLEAFLDLHTGFAKQADQAFANGTLRRKIFNPNHKLNFLPGAIDCSQLENWNEAKKIAQHHHPRWNFLEPYQQDLIARNTYQILNTSLDHPVLFVICWTPDGAIKTTSSKTGGTGQAIRIANTFNIPVYNIQNPDCVNHIELILNGIIDF